MENQLNLYPKIKPYDSGFLNVDQHQVYLSNVAIQMESQLFSFMEVLVVVAVKMLEDFLILICIE